MALRRALVTAPLAVFVAIGAHLAAFGPEHALGGSAAGTFFVLGLGGVAFLALAAILWVAVRCGETSDGERALLAALPGRTWLETGGALALCGFGAFAAGELLEHRAPLGSTATALALVSIAALVALAARTLVRWLAGGGVALAALFERPLAAAPEVAVAVAPRTVSHRRLDPARGSRRGRAPPRFA